MVTELPKLLLFLPENSGWLNFILPEKLKPSRNAAVCGYIWVWKGNSFY